MTYNTTPSLVVIGKEIFEMMAFFGYCPEQYSDLKAELGNDSRKMHAALAERLVG